MKRSLSLFSSLVLASTAVWLSSCDSGSNSTKDDTPAPKDTVVTPVATVAAPVFSPVDGIYATAQSVTLSTSTSGATIYYTTDGRVPTVSSTRYTSPVSVGATQLLRAIAVKSGMTTSSVSSAAYVISMGSSTSTIPWNTSVTYGSLSYGGQTYKTVVIGTQRWMAENLNYKVDSSWWHENSADSGAKYGRLYTWASALGLADSCNKKVCSSQVQVKHQGVCPSGWHVPSYEDWRTLWTYLRDKDVAGGYLKSTSGWTNESGSGNGENAYGFRGLPAGRRSFDGFMEGVGSFANFWSSSEGFDATFAGTYELHSAHLSLARGSSYKWFGFSVRCLKDGP